jgi:hypothetical protein
LKECSGRRLPSAPSAMAQKCLPAGTRADDHGISQRTRHYPTPRGGAQRERAAHIQ